MHSAEFNFMIFFISDVITKSRHRQINFSNTAAFLDHQDSSLAAWLSLTGALHGCVYDRTIQEKDTRK